MFLGFLPMENVVTQGTGLLAFNYNLKFILFALIRLLWWKMLQLQLLQQICTKIFGLCTINKFLTNVTHPQRVKTGQVSSCCGATLQQSWTITRCYFPSLQQTQKGWGLKKDKNIILLVSDGNSFWKRLPVKSRYNNAKCHPPSHHTTAIKNDFMRRSECKDEKNVSSCALMGNSIFVISKKCQILNTIFPGINAAALINFLDVSTRRLFGDGACVRKAL